MSENAMLTVAVAAWTVVQLTTVALKHRATERAAVRKANATPKEKP